MVKITLDESNPETTTFGQLKPGDWFMTSYLWVKLNTTTAGSYSDNDNLLITVGFNVDSPVTRLDAEIKLTPAK